jgi:hypothetical protein
MYSRGSSLIALTALLGLPAMPAWANGRMPGANDIAFNSGNPAQLVARATFGIVQSFDSGSTWQWICEQVIDVSGVIADPPLAVMADGTQVLLPPTGSALISMDHGCSWQRAAEPLAGNRGVDLTLDPSDPERILLLMSTSEGIDAEGFGLYRNLVVESRDNGHTFQVLATLANDFLPETLEVAKSDAQRIYVSGTDRKNSRLGIVERTEDGGGNWQRSTVDLPAGTGSLFISAIAPDNPDRLWVRVPARGDTLGLLPARLMFSDDKGQTFRMLAQTQRAMFGLALSPDGTELAYGGPNDGLFVGPSDGSGAFVKRSGLGVKCLRWTEADELYVCASEPQDPFSVGVSRDHGVSFHARYRMVDTCPASCEDGTTFAQSCESAWSATRPFINASAAMCSVPWARPQGDDAGAAVDGGTSPAAPLDGGDRSQENSSDGCSCRVSARRSAQDAGFVFAALVLWLERRRRARVTVIRGGRQ